MRVVFLGDSLTWGGYGGNFVSLVAQQLPQHTVINAGVGGDTVYNLVQRAESVITTHEPDYLFSMVGGNDAVSYTQPLTRGYYRKAKALPNGFITPDEFESLYRDLLTLVSLHYVQPLVGLAPTEYNAELVQAKREYNQRAQTVADALNVPVLDLDTPFTPANPIQRPPVNLAFIQEIGTRGQSGWNAYESERQKWGYTYTFDGMHLTPQAAHEFAAQIVPFLREHLR